MGNNNRQNQAEQELAALRKSFDELSRAMAAQTRMMALQGEQIDQLVKMLRRREAQVKKANQAIRKLQRELAEAKGDREPDPEPSAAEVPDEGDGTDNADDSIDASSTDGSSSQCETTSNGPLIKKPRPRSYGGRRPPPSHLPTEMETYNVCDCSHCGAGVLKRDVLTSRLYTVVAEHVRCREIRRERVLCTNPDCNKPTTAPMPPMPCQRALYDCRFLAWLVVMKFGLLVPLDRMRLLLREQGVHIAMGSLVHLIERAASLADAVDGEHMRQLKRGPWMCFDGTGLKTLMVGQDKAWDGYLEVYTREEITVFQFDLTKHADELRERIGDYTNMLVCDAESRNMKGAVNATIVHCNAHAVRKFRDAQAVQPRLAAQGGRFLQALYHLEDEADAEGLWGAERLAFRQRRSRRVLRRFRQWLEGVLARTLPPSDPLGKVCRYYLKHWQTLTRFIDHAELPLDNNAAEREFQRHAKLRYASLFAGSPEGAHRWATLLGVVRTAQKCEVDVFGYLNWLFERRGTHRHQFGMRASELTPLAYRAAGCPGAVKAAA